MQYEKGTLKPEWESKIPIGEAGEIFYDGISNLPKFGDLIIAHTTIYDGGFCSEDNRICAIDINTGDIKWYFPDNLSERHYCHFNSEGYLYNGKLVFQYAKNYKDEHSRSMHTTVCLDAKDGTFIWERDGETPCGSTRPAQGAGHECFFLQGKSKILKVDLNTDKIIDFYYTGSDDIYINDILLYNNYLVVSCFSDSVEEYKLETEVVIIDISTREQVFKKYLGVSNVPSHNFSDGRTLYSNVNTYLAAFDIRTGDKLWERDDEWTYVLQNLHIYKDVIFKSAVNATTGYDKNTGAILYNYDDYGSYFTSIHGKYVYLINRKGVVDILDIETGERLDKIVCPYGSQGFEGSSPVIYDSKFYVMGANRLFRYPTYPWR